MGAVGAGIVIRGPIQLGKAYAERVKEKIGSFEPGSGTRPWLIRANKVGLTARGVVFSIIGGSVVYAAFTQDLRVARGLDGALDFLVSIPRLLAGVGSGLVCCAVYQRVKAGYRLIGV